MSWRSDGGQADSGSSAAAAQPPDAAVQPPQPSQPLPAELANVPIAVRALQRSGVIAIPTDTLYGEHVARRSHLVNDEFRKWQACTSGSWLYAVLYVEAMTVSHHSVGRSADFHRTVDLIYDRLVF